jgi:histidinol-phosphate aminotransferase
MIENLQKFSSVTKIYPTDANFVLIKTIDAETVYKFLVAEKIIVRNRNNVELCAGCLRITIGTPRENKSLLESFKKYETTLLLG